MQFISHGAAREVTGSCHEIQVETPKGMRRVLLDCGLFQGRRAEAAEKNAMFTLHPKKDVDAVILTHAHMDHVGRIPVLFKRGYAGPVFCTYATKDLAAVMLQDGGYIQEKDEEYFRKHIADSALPGKGPLYTQQDAKECMALFRGENMSEWFPVCDGVRAQFVEAGHIVGAVMVVLEVTENGGTHRIGFSGDLGRNMLPIIRDPAPMPPVETLICESTYGNRKHDDIDTARHHLCDVITRTAQRGGKVFIPAFSLERAQETLFDLHVLWDAKEIPPMPIVVDSPLTAKVTEVFMKHPECYDKDMYEKFLAKAKNPFQFSLVRFTESPDESKALNATPGPMIILAGSGMCEAGRIRHHLKNGIEDARNAVVAVGYMAVNTLGRRLTDPTVTQVKIFDRLLQKKAEVMSIAAYSGHADMADLDRFVLATQELKTLILVHGEPEQMDPFAGRIAAARPGVVIHKPEREKEITL
ncbi:MAG: MBL fold metallo-hydrolase [Candidatus Peribacteraceae bacterium]|nr:MBL fold metallo-hydrolase [Candidatus Peribacteraceae bacterium]MDD5742071.1 MBL fold metallo-hydrolase [Candidatus Peribacteraceae bacterium]